MVTEQALVVKISAVVIVQCQMFAMMHRMCGKTKLPTVASWSLLMDQMRQVATVHKG
jgi:hypothetical protein